MPIVDTLIKPGVPNPRTKIARGQYDFAVNGGAVSTIALMGATLIPSGAMIIGGFIDITTQCTSGGAATIAVQVEAAQDVVPNTVAIGAWTVGRKAVIPGLTAGNTLAASAGIKTTAARDISIVIATAALTAGKFSVVLFYADPLA